MSKPAKRLFIVLLPLIAALSVYLNSLTAPFIFDDNHKIVHNPDIKRLEYLKTRLIRPYDRDNRTPGRNNPSRPVVYATYALNYHMGKLDPLGYHIFNLLLHLLNTLLVFLISKKVFSGIGIKDPHYPAGYAAFLFAVHPINTEAVTYIYGRSNLLAAFFMLLSLILLFGPQGKKYRFSYPVSLLSYSFALLSKEISVIFPVILLLYEYLVYDPSAGPNTGKMKRHAPFWILAVSFLVFRYFYLGGIDDIEAYAKRPALEYLAVQPQIIISYIRLLFLPLGQCIDHFVPRTENFITARAVFSAVFLLLLPAAAILNARRKTRDSKIILLGTLWFFTILAPTSSVFPTATPFVERRLYLPGAGVFLIFALAVHRLVNAPKKLWIRQFYASLFILYLAALGLLTVNRNRLYNDPLLMWQDVNSRYPDKLRSYINMSGILLENGQYGKILGIMKGRKLSEDADEYILLGYIYQKMKRYDSADVMYSRALEIEPGNARVYNNRGLLNMELNEYDKASGDFEKAIGLDPGYANPYNNLGMLYGNINDNPGAEKMHKKAVELEPDNGGFRYNLGIAYIMNGKYKSALSELKTAAALDPSLEESGYYAGIASFYLKDYGAAIKYFAKYVRLHKGGVPADKAKKISWMIRQIKAGQGG
ncbi:MAG: tetratricopeptide repeat protein [Elusimicrobia bacterium]|nr:tetratricopeptide repeat protein [Elusimicrobiota bacterium]